MMEENDPDFDPELELEIESLQKQVDLIIKKGLPQINGVMEGDLKPEEYLEKTNNLPGLIGYMMSVIRTDVIVREWYYSERERYDSHCLIDSIVNSLNTILESKTNLDNHLEMYPFFSKAYHKYLEVPDRDTRHFLSFLYLYS